MLQTFFSNANASFHSGYIAPLVNARSLMQQWGRMNNIAHTVLPDRVKHLQKAAQNTQTRTHATWAANGEFSVSDVRSQCFNKVGYENIHII